MSDKLPQEKISRKAFDSLPEYSMSNPTGAFPGNVWKRDLNWHRHHGADPNWIICEFVDHPTDKTLLRIEYRRPVVADAEGLG
jgi:hypothetical protein